MSKGISITRFKSPATEYTLLQPQCKNNPLVSHRTHVETIWNTNETNNLQRIALLYFLIL